MPMAARVTDMHTCPMITVLVPHVGGPILPPGMPTVLIGGLPAARVTDRAFCVGPPDVIVKGSATVTIGGLSAVRMGDTTAHGGVIVAGFSSLIIARVTADRYSNHHLTQPGRKIFASPRSRQSPLAQRRSSGGSGFSVCHRPRSPCRSLW